MGGLGASSFELQGEGDAPRIADDALGLARRRAVASIAEQVRVEIRSSFSASETYQQQGDHTDQALDLSSQLDTRATAAIEGAEVRDTCSDGANLRVRVALNRARFARDGGQRLEAMAAELRDLYATATRAEDGHDRLRAIAIWSDALPRATAAEELALAIRVVGRSGVTIEFPSRATVDANARRALARVVVRLDVQSPQGADLIAQVAIACLATAGIPISSSADAHGADAVVALQIAVDPALKVADALYVARATLSASVRRPSENTAIAAGARRLKGGGANPAAAQHEAVRRLTAESLSSTIDEALKGLHWTWLRRCDAGPH
jgi:hypothetical protein